MHVETLIIGAGPAGLTAAYNLARSGRSVAVIEGDPAAVGDLSRTVNFYGYHLRVGGRGAPPKTPEVLALWTELLGDQLLEGSEAGRTYYRGKLFAEPLQAAEALDKLGPFEALRCVLSYAKAKAVPYLPPRNFEEWAVNAVGRRLFEIFFKTYAEKLWGLDCTEMSADWAAQSISGPNLYQALLSRRSRAGKSGAGRGKVKAPHSAVRHPGHGPAQLWEAARDRTVVLGGRLLMGSNIVKLSQFAANNQWIAIIAAADGRETKITADHLVSTVALNDLVRRLGADSEPAVGMAAAGLRYRDILKVGLIARGRERVNDTSLQIHDPGVKVGRIQNLKAASPDMVPAWDTAGYGMEYFCAAGDGLNARSDAELIALATDEIGKLGLVAPGTVIDGLVLRQPNAYPVYDDLYRFHVDTIRDGLASRFVNLHLASDIGMPEPDDQNHMALTGLLIARDIIAGTKASNAYHNSTTAAVTSFVEHQVHARVAAE